MCLVSLSFNQHPRYPFVLAANRDEYYARPAAPLDWWTPPTGAEPILSGRDLEGGGTWLGLVRSGRFALLTNVRDPSGFNADAPSRGLLVNSWLESDDTAARFCERHSVIPYNGFNLVAGNARTGEWFWTSNRAPSRTPLTTGLYGLSNAALDTPWPKVIALKQRTGAALSEAGSVPELASDLFSALADRRVADDRLLPSTGVPAQFERELSATFVDMPSRGYGTRCSTVIVTEAHGGAYRTHVFELTAVPHAAPSLPSPGALRGHLAGSIGVQGMRHFAIDGWMT